MPRLLLAAALLATSATSPLAPAVAKGPKPPPVSTEECYEDQGYTFCAYDSSSECTSALRALRRERPAYLNGCYLSSADPDWWSYGRWVLEYYY